MGHTPRCVLFVYGTTVAPRLSDIRNQPFLRITFIDPAPVARVPDESHSWLFVAFALVAPELIRWASWLSFPLTNCPHSFRMLWTGFPT